MSDATFIPMYAFLEGDTLGLLIFAMPTDTVSTLAAKVLQAAQVRVRPTRVQVVYRGKTLSDAQTVAQVGLQALERLDVVRLVN